MKRIRGGSGLGDALYVQAVARHLVKRGEELEVCSKWHDVFRYLPVKLAPFSRENIDYLAHYTHGKAREGTTQFEDVCRSCGIEEPVDFRLDWIPVRPRSFPKPVCLVQTARAPMDREDGFGAEILPDCRIIQRAINAIRKTHYVILVGRGEQLYQFENIDLDLSNQTKVTDLLDLASIADKFLGYCSFMVPLAESFDRPALFVWSSKIKKSEHAFIRAITPQKILHKQTSLHVYDNQSPVRAIAAFCQS